MNKLYRLLSASLIAAATLYSCGSSTTPKSDIIDLDSITENVDINLSEMVKDLTFVPLETTDDLLLNVRAGISFVTDKSIFTMSDDGIYQFDRSGKYIRKVVSKGQGPNEFNQIRKILVDEKRGILYFSEISTTTQIKRIDIASSKALDPIILKNYGYVIHEIDSEGIIYGTVSNRSILSIDEDEAGGDNIIVFTYNPDNEEISEIIGAHENLSPTTLSGGLKYNGKEMLFLNFGYADTLYKLNNNILTPIAPILFTEKLIDMQTGGKEFVFNNFLKNKIIGSISDRKMIISTDSKGEISGISVFNSIDRYIEIDQNNIVRNISTNYIDKLDYTADIAKVLEEKKEYAANRNGDVVVSGAGSSTPAAKSLFTSPATQTGEYIFWVIQAENFKSLIENNSQFEELNKRINEDDNQIFVIGKVK